MGSVKEALRNMFAGKTVPYLAAAAFSCLLAVPGAASAAEAEKFRLVFTSQVISPNDAVPTYAVPQKLGFFRDEGLDVTWSTSDGSSAGILAVASGGGDVTSASAVSSLPAIAKGLKVKTFGGLVIHWPYRFAVLPDNPVQSIEDLKGRKIGIISLASASYTFAKSSAKLAGMGEDAVTYIAVGEGPSAAAALQSGQVDALALYGGAYQGIEGAGLKLRYLDSAPYFEKLFSTSWLARDDDLQARPEVFAKFLRAVSKGLLFSAANPDEAMKIGVEVFPDQLQEANHAADTATLKAWLASATPSGGTPADWKDFQWGALSDDQWDAMQGYLVDGGVITEKFPLDQIWDGAAVAEANKFDRDAVLELAKPK